MGSEKNFKKALDTIAELDLEYEIQAQKIGANAIGILKFLYWHAGSAEATEITRALDPTSFGDLESVAEAWISYNAQCKTDSAAIGRASRTGFVDFMKGAGLDARAIEDLLRSGSISENQIEGIESAKRAIAELQRASTWIARCEILADELANGAKGINALPSVSSLAEKYGSADKSAIRDLAITPEAIGDCYAEIVRTAQNDAQSRIKYGFKNLDQYSGGMYRGGINVIIARPGERKTTFLTNVAANHLLSGSGLDIVMISAEMPKNRIFFRIAMAVSGHGSRIVTDYLAPVDFSDPDRMAKEAAIMSELVKKTRITIIDDTDIEMDISPVISHLEKLYLKGTGPDLVMIDYFQLIGNPAMSKKPKHESLADISQQLRRFCTRHPRTAMLVLAQARRSGTQSALNQPKPWPDLDSVAESDRIARDAWQALALSRCQAHDNDINDGSEGSYGLEILKNREGAIGYEPLKVLEAQQKILECDEFRRDRPPDWQKGSKGKKLKV